ncbi:hypothetical protein [Nonomuraea endophytica]|uniref:hypothetical protein n=1 Tax=Nonomuraea endophytica TaxID=714136 RepID=UPI0037CBA0F4
MSDEEYDQHRAHIVADLRELAKIIEETPDLPVPWNWDFSQELTGASDVRQLIRGVAHAARLLGESALIVRGEGDRPDVYVAEKTMTHGRVRYLVFGMLTKADD